MSLASVFGKIGADISKGATFILNVFTKTQAVLTVVNKVGPGTLAALLAVFYDVMTLVLKGGVDFSTKNFADIFSDTTKALIAKLATDFQAAEADVVDDFHQLGIALKSDSLSNQQALLDSQKAQGGAILGQASVAK